MSWLDILIEEGFIQVSIGFHLKAHVLEVCDNFLDSIGTANHHNLAGLRGEEGGQETLGQRFQVLQLNFSQSFDTLSVVYGVCSSEVRFEGLTDKILNSFLPRSLGEDL